MAHVQWSQGDEGKKLACHLAWKKKIIWLGGRSHCKHTSWKDKILRVPSLCALSCSMTCTSLCTCLFPLHSHRAQGRAGPTRNRVQLGTWAQLARCWTGLDFHLEWKLWAVALALALAEDMNRLFPWWMEPWRRIPWILHHKVFHETPSSWGGLRKLFSPWHPKNSASADNKFNGFQYIHIYKCTDHLLSNSCLSNFLLLKKMGKQKYNFLSIKKASDPHAVILQKMKSMIFRKLVAIYQPSNQFSHSFNNCSNFLELSVEILKLWNCHFKRLGLYLAWMICHF